MRHKIFRFCLVLIFPFNVLAQPYSIPWATQQPGWVFPVFIEDAIGQRDTVYFGFDHSAMPHPGNQDLVFGEKNFPIDQFNFQASVNMPFADSISKVDIIGDTSYFAFGYLFPLAMTNVHMPVTLKYDNSLFYSDSFPRVDQDPLPRGQGEISWYYSPNSILHCSSNDIILISDTISPTMGSCVYPDSLVIYHEFGFTVPVNVFVAIGFRAWTGASAQVGIATVDRNTHLKLFPNPSSDYLNITTDNSFVELKIYNHLGNELFSKNFTKGIKTYKLNTQDFNIGIYYIKLLTGKELICQTFIVLK